MLAPALLSHLPEGVTVFVALRIAPGEGAMGAAKAGLPGQSMEAEGLAKCQGRGLRSRCPRP